jgi:hypothetical protein
VQIKDQKLLVLRMHLTYSLFRNQDKKFLQIPHTVLQSEWIVNVTRSKRWGKWKFKQEYIKECQNEQVRKDMRSLLADYSILLRQERSPLEQHNLEMVNTQLNEDFKPVMKKISELDQPSCTQKDERHDLHPVLENFLREGPVLYHHERSAHSSDWTN